MKSKLKIIFPVAFVVGLIWAAAIFISHLDMAVLSPQGVVAEKQRHLMLVATLLTLIVVVPVFVLLGYITWKYREGNTRAKYEPEWTNRKLEIIWWGVQRRRVNHVARKDTCCSIRSLTCSG